MGTAIDIDQPPWWLIPDLATTWQVWSFDNSSFGPVEPDSVGFDSLLGTHLTVYPQSYWLTQHNSFNYYGLTGGTGVWQLSGTGINAHIVNYDIPALEKHIWIQVTWAAQQPGNVPSIVIEDDSGTQTVPVTAPLILTSLDNGWFHSTYEVILNSGSPFEVINISGSVFIDDLVIDTLLIPEPASIFLVIIGTLLFRRK
ncbi:MAG: hypothetical protein BWY69_00389 [Planctomycetes bacterium ADurb.Bin401]|nr:MAG: hypothetical protein BWY69_00389 [Planctomycetes bacterium ADurb.Bin401]